MGVSIVMGVSKNGWFRTGQSHENRWWLGVPLFQETTILSSESNSGIPSSKTISLVVSLFLSCPHARWSCFVCWFLMYSILVFHVSRSLTSTCVLKFIQIWASISSSADFSHRIALPAVSSPFPSCPASHQGESKGISGPRCQSRWLGQCEDGLAHLSARSRKPNILVTQQWKCEVNQKTWVQSNYMGNYWKQLYVCMYICI